MNKVQRSFTAGEISPSLHARVDQVRYSTGLATLRNFMVMRHGGVTNKPGSYFVTEVKDSTRKTRIIPFLLSSGEALIVELGHQYIHLIYNNAKVESGGSPYNIPSPYQESEIFDVKFTQRERGGAIEELVLTHPSYTTTRLLIKNPLETSLLLVYTLVPAQGAPTGLSSDAPGSTYNYKVTAVGVDTAEESLPTSAVGSSTKTSTLSWTASVGGADYYNIYREINGTYGWIGLSAGTSFKDEDYTPDVLDRPPEDRQPFSSTDNYPSVVAHYQQRMIFASTNNNRNAGFASKTGLPFNFNLSTPLQDDDPVTFSLFGRRSNVIKHLLDLGRLVIFTNDGEWIVEGDSAGILKPTAINPRQYSQNGSANIPPLVVSGSAIYLQSRNSVVRDLGYEFATDSYRGNELSIFSAHLVDQFTIVDWAYQQIPHSIVWLVRSDGVLLGMTYLKEHEIIGWHRHDTDGSVESVAVIPSGTEDVLYMVVNRTINGVPKRYIEYLTSRNFTDIKNAIFMDCALTYDGTNTDTNHTMTLSGNLADDTFTEASNTPLESHASDSGFSWSGFSETSITVIGADDEIEAETTGYLYGGLNASLPTADYSVTVRGKTGADNSNVFGACARLSKTATLHNGYILILQGDGQWFLVKVVNNSFTTLDNGTVTGFSQSTYYNLKLQVEGTTIKGFIDGTQVGSDQTDGTFVLANYPGFILYNISGSNYPRITSIDIDTIDGDIRVLTSSQAYFSAGEVGNAIHLTGSDGTVIKFLIDTYLTTTVVRGTPDITVPAGMQETAISAWARAVDVVTGLSHLEGKAVSVLGDGYVLASPNNSEYSTITVTGGQITLSQPFAVVHVGLPYICDIETLDIDVAGLSTMMDRKKNVTALSLYLESTRGLFVGPDVNNLSEMQVEGVDFTNPATLVSGHVELNILGQFSGGGRVFVRQVDPLPASILAIVPKGL